MTAVTMAPLAPRNASLGRIVHAARLHAANPWTTLVLPWLIYAAIFGLTYAIWRTIVMGAGGLENLNPDAFMYNGGGTWVLFYMLVVAVQAMNLTFKFALGLCLTRREYYLGTSVYFVLLSLMYATGITLAGLVERATDGWGLNGSFFVPFFLRDAPVGQVWFTWFGLFTLFFFVGAAVATVFVRWGANGLIVFFASLALLLVATVWSIVNFGIAGDIGAWFAARSLNELVGVALVVSAVSGLVGYGLMRRATPRA
jgi:hypothetical protein